MPKRNSIETNLVEDSSSILKRFGSGGISFGAISEKSHRELARGFALSGARSNTGEGGEMSDRYSISNTDRTINSHVSRLQVEDLELTVNIYQQQKKFK